MKKINTFIKNGLILTISTLFLRFIAVLFNIFLSNKISSSLLGTFGIILSVFAFFLTIALSGINLSSTRLVSEDYSFNKSNMSNLDKENFNTFNENIFSDEVDLSKYKFNISPRKNIINIKNKCIDFVNNFDNINQKNLLFTGNTGLR